MLGGRRKRIGEAGAGDGGGKGHKAGNKVQEASRITTVSIFGFESQGRPSFPHPTQSHVPLTRVPPLTCGCAESLPPPLSYQLVQKRLLALKEDQGVQTPSSQSVPEWTQVLLSPTPAKMPRDMIKALARGQS